MFSNQVRKERLKSERLARQTIPPEFQMNMTASAAISIDFEKENYKILYCIYRKLIYLFYWAF